MGRCSIQIVMGPAGSGKSTYCQTMQEHVQGARRGRRLHVANLDPAAEHFGYEPYVDVRELIQVQEVMSELGLGPNGALVYCMEYLLSHLEWLHDAVESLDDDDACLLLDCPGQVELYTHVPVMKTILDRLKMWGYDGKLVSVFCVDAAFLSDFPKYLSGSLLALSAMIALELPHVNVLTKADLMATSELESILSQSPSQLWHAQTHGPDEFQPTSPYRRYNVEEENNDDNNNDNNNTHSSNPVVPSLTLRPLLRRDERLTDALCQLLEDYSMVSFLPLNIRDEDSIDHVLATVDHAVQYGEDVEVRADDDVDPYEPEEAADGDHG